MLEELDDAHRCRRDLLEVVEHQEDVPIAQLLLERVERPCLAGQGDADGAGHGGEGVVDLPLGAQVDEEDPVGEVRDLVERGPDREPRLAGAAGTGERDEPHVLGGR